MATRKLGNQYKTPTQRKAAASARVTNSAKKVPLRAGSQLSRGVSATKKAQVRKDGKLSERKDFIKSRGAKLMAKHVNPAKKREAAAAAAAKKTNYATDSNPYEKINTSSAGKAVPKEVTTKKTESTGVFPSKSSRNASLRRTENTNPLTGKLSGIGKKKIETRVKAGVATSQEKAAIKKAAEDKAKNTAARKKGVSAFHSTMKWLGFGPKKIKTKAEKEAEKKKKEAEKKK